MNTNTRLIAVFSLMALLALGMFISGAPSVVAETTPTLTTDKADYSPGEIVVITGTGFAPGDYALPVLRPDGSIVVIDPSLHIAVNGWDTVTADANGNLTYNYQLNGIEGLYEARAYPAGWAGDWNETPVASVTFTDAALGLNLDQCRNGTLANLGVDCGSVGSSAPAWENGNINGSNSQYREGDGLPYRNSITKLSNDTWTIRVEYDFTQGGDFAIDRLTRIDLTQHSDPCASTSDITCTKGSPAFTFTMPGEVVSPDATHPALPNSGALHIVADGSLSLPTDAQMTVWVEGGTATFVSTGQNFTGVQATSFNDDKVLQNGLSTGNSERQFAFKVTLSGCSGSNCKLMLGWTGHIASAVDWGAGNGAASISGAPFHMRIIGVDNLDGTSGGNQDRSVQLSAITQTLTVNKACLPSTDPGLFNLFIDTTQFTDKACGTGTGPQSVDADSHTVSETAGTGTDLANYTTTISCVDEFGTTVASGSGTSLTVNVADGANVVCTITNTRKPRLTVNKVLVPSSDTGKFNLRIDGITYATDVGDGGTTGPQFVSIGTHMVDETVGTGTSLSNYTTVIGGDCATDGSVTLAAGDNKTCTITNTLKQGTIIVEKQTDPDGSSQSFEFDPSYAANFFLTDGQQNDSGPLAPGTYSVAEVNLPAGWGLTSAVCSDGSAVSAISLQAGETVTCVFTDTFTKFTPTVTTAIHDASHAVVISVPLGSTVHDSATVSGSAGTPTGTVTFDWFPNGSCSGSPTATSGSFALSGGSVDATTFTQGPLAAGSYSFKAHYSGDSVYNAADSACEPLTVDKADSSTVTEIHNGGEAVVTSVPLGTTVHDQATVTGIAAFAPTGSVAFTFYTTANDCTGASVAAGSVALAGNPGVAHPSDSFGPLAAGSYSFKASYPGDSNYNGSTSLCEPLEVEQADTTITTEVHNPSHVDVTNTTVVAGTPVHDSATVSGQVGGFVITGTVTYKFYNNATCTGTPVSTETVPVGTESTAQTLTLGYYCYMASYSGDANYNASVGAIEPFHVVPSNIITDTSRCIFDRDPNLAGQQFRNIFTQDPMAFPSFKMTATNPGQFFYNVFYTGNPGDSVTFNITLPYPFVTQGANPVHGYNGVSTYTSSGQTCFTPGGEFFVGSQQVILSDYTNGTYENLPYPTGDSVGTTSFNVTVTVPSSGFVFLAIHLDYGLKGTVGYGNSNNNAVQFGSISSPPLVYLVPDLADHTFLVGGAQTGSSTIENQNTFKKNPGVGGLVCQGPQPNCLGSNTPVAGATIVLKKGITTVGTGITDDDGWYQIVYKHTGKAAPFTVTFSKVGYVTQTKSVTLKANAYAQVDFIVVPSP